MDVEYKELKETVKRWNEYNRAGTNSILSILSGIVYIGAGIYIMSVMANNGAPLNMRLIFLIPPAIGVFQIIRSLINRKKVADLKSRLDETGKEKVEAVKELVKEMSNAAPLKDDHTIMFEQSKGTGKDEDEVTWYVKFKGDDVILLRSPIKELHLSNVHSFKIIKSGKALLSGDFKAKMNLDGKEHEITITPDEYAKYMKLLEESFEREGNEAAAD